MKKKLIAGMTSTALIASIGAPAFAANFSDVNGHWAAATINKLADAGIINGMDASNFAPEGTLTRAQFAKLITVALKLDTSATASSFADVSGWAVGFVEAAKKAGIINGTDATHFDPNGTLTREQAAAIMVRALKTQGTLQDATDINFPDAAQVSSWFKSDVAVAIKNGLLNGKDGKLAPQGNATRAEAAVLTDRFLTKADELKAAVKDLKVGSVSAINAKQIQVQFTKPVDKTTATTVTNYTIKKAGSPAATLATGADQAVLSDDQKTLTITLASALTVLPWSFSNGDVFVFGVTGVKDAQGNKIADTTLTVSYSDKVAPQFVSATAKAKTSTNTVTLTFSEPVDYSVAIANVNGSAASLSAGTNPNEVKVTTGSSLTAGQTYSVSLLNFKDFAGNLLDPNPVNAQVSVVADTTAANVTNVAVVRDSLLEVTFDKAMDVNTLTAANVKVLDSNLNTTGITQGTIVVKPNTTDNKTFQIPLTALPFNSQGTFTGVVAFTNSVLDLSGNALNTVQKAIAVTKDTTAPQLVSSSYKNVSSYNGITTANGAIVVKFNEAISANTSAVFTVIDDQGTSISTPFGIPVVNSNDNTEFVLPLSAPVASTAKSYTVVAPSGAVKDLSLTGNNSAAVNLLVDVTAGVPVAADTVAPTVTGVTYTAATSSTTGTVIRVALADNIGGSGLDATTIANTNNYRLDGAPLASGSYVTFAVGVATINIPAGSIAKDKTYALNINGIKDKAGNTIAPFAGNVVLNDDIKPVLTAATLNTNGSASLTFSEAVNTVTSATYADFGVTVNGTLLTATTAPAWTLVNGSGADAGKYVLAVQKSKQGSTAAVTINGTTYTPASGSQYLFSFIDANGNGIVDNGDIILSAVQQTATSATPFTADGNFDLNTASSLKVTVTGAATVKDTSINANPITTATAIVVK